MPWDPSVSLPPSPAKAGTNAWTSLRPTTRRRASLTRKPWWNRHPPEIVGAAAIVAVGLLSLWLIPWLTDLNNQLRATATPQPPSPSATATPTPSPSPSPSPSGPPTADDFVTFQQPPRPDWLPEHTWEELQTQTSFPESLTEHPLFLAEYPVADCPDPYHFETHEEYRRYAEELATCILQAWTPHFETLGVALEPILVESYDREIQTPCGYQGPRFPAFYCSANNTFYLSSKSLNYAAKHPTEGAMTTIHEVFHHIQLQSGIGHAGYSLPIDYWEISRRLELQAICSESRQALTLDIGFTAEDYERVMHNLGIFGEEVHGSNESLTYWGGRGFHITTLQGCNTWVVPADMVD